MIEFFPGNHSCCCLKNPIVYRNKELRLVSRKKRGAIRMRSILYITEKETDEVLKNNISYIPRNGDFLWLHIKKRGLKSFAHNNFCWIIFGKIFKQIQQVFHLILICAEKTFNLHLISKPSMCKEKKFASLLLFIYLKV